MTEVISLPAEEEARQAFPPPPRRFPLRQAAAFEGRHDVLGPALYRALAPAWFLRWALWDRSVRRGRPWPGTRTSQPVPWDWAVPGEPG